MNRGIKVLQTSALPLGYVATLFAQLFMLACFLFDRPQSALLRSAVVLGDPDQARTDDLQRDRLAF